MSYATFMASDCPMQEVENPLIQLFSVNEALEKDIALSSIVIDSQTIDRDKPAVIVWVEKEEDFDEITIKDSKKAWYRYDDGSSPDTDLQCFSSIEWRYTGNRAVKLIEYIHVHLEKATEIEIWHTWIGGGRDESEVIIKHCIRADDLAPFILERLFNGANYDCLSIKK